MKITNISRGAVAFTVAGTIIELQPGEDSHDLTDAEATSFAGQPILMAWVEEGRVCTSGAPSPAPAPSDEAPKPARKRVKAEG